MGNLFVKVCLHLRSYQHCHWQKMLKKETKAALTLSSKDGFLNPKFPKSNGTKITKNTFYGTLMIT
jgi:hypothetical protein